MTLIRQRVKWIYLVLAIAGLTAGLVYLTIRFNNYLDANAEGICWPEGRKLGYEEMRVRALKTILMEAQRQADMDNVHISQEYDRASLLILNRDMDESVLLSLSAKYLNIYRAIEEEKLIAKPIEFSRSEDAFYKELIDKKYSLISSEQGSFMGTATHYVVGIMRPSVSKIYEKNDVDEITASSSNFFDQIHGFGTYYFYVGNLAAPLKLNAQTDKNYYLYYQVNNCANSSYKFLTTSKFSTVQAYNKQNKKREMSPSRSILTVISEFMKGL